MNLTHDWHATDNMRPIRLRSRRTAEDWEVYTAVALRRPMRFTDLAGGVYTKADCKWLVPHEIAKPLGQLKPSDVVEEADGTEWIALDVEVLAEGTWLALMSRNLVIAHDLQDLLDIWQPVNSQDLSANRTATFQVLHEKIPGRLQPISGDVVDAFGKLAIAKRYTAYLATQLTVSQEVAVTNEMQIRINGSTQAYGIVAWRNAARIGDLFEIDVEIMP